MLICNRYKHIQNGAFNEASFSDQMLAASAAGIIFFSLLLFFYLILFFFSLSASYISFYLCLYFRCFNDNSNKPNMGYQK